MSTANAYALKETADKQEWRTAIRLRANGTQRGGTPFSFGHIHHILTNPVYAGRIKHKTMIYQGQHPPLIDPDVWDDLQKDLQDNARAKRAGRARSRGGRRTSYSPLIGKLFDETGDGLTPSHTKTKKGQRLRYYISHRLMREPRSKHPSAWRLPAPTLEDVVGQAMAQHLAKPATLSQVRVDADAATMARMAGEDLANGRDALRLVSRIDVSPGLLSIMLDQSAVAEHLGCHPEQIQLSCLSFTASFTQRRRGVETKLMIGGTQAEIDQTLLKNLAKGHRYFEMICSGLSYAQIAEREKTSKRMVQHLTDVRLSVTGYHPPDLQRTQPAGLTTEWLKRNKLPELWRDQVALIERL